MRARPPSPSVVSPASPLVVSAALVLTLVSSSSCGGPDAPPLAPTPPTPKTASAPPAPAPPPVPHRVPPPSGVPASFMDPDVDPCDDFYAYACSGWRKATPLPDDRARYGAFEMLAEQNQTKLRGYLEQAMKNDLATPYAAKLADYYAACMDEAAVEKRGAAPLKAPFAIVDRIQDKAGIGRAVVELTQQGYGSVVVSFGSVQDYADASMVIGQLSAGGLGLPDRDYYTKGDPKSLEILAAYEAHVAATLKLAGEKPELAKAVVAMETAFAKARLQRAALREPKNRYHKLDVAGVAALAPTVPWAQLVAAMGVPKTAPVNVVEPEFMKALEERMAVAPPAEWRAFLKWQIVHAMAPGLPKAFVDEDFAFRSKNISGEKAQLPRWKRCVASADGSLGEALGRPFALQTFGAEGKAQNLKMIEAIEQAMDDDLRGLAWMDAGTRERATYKLKHLTNKIGFPATWRSYDALEIVKGDHAGNVRRAALFEQRRRLAQIGKPVDRAEFNWTPPTVNASYSSSMNAMTFPAGILQPPFFGRERPFAVNYGAIGVVMGHELTHGFDDQGRKFDGDGNLKDWWDPQVNARFEEKAACVGDEYASFVAAPDVHLNPKLTMGENLADLGGVKLAHAAMQRLPEQVAAAPGEKVANDRRFFIGFAQVWCQNGTEEDARNRALTDPHSPGRYRVNGVVQNLPQFAAAFGCTAKDKMVRPNRCEVW